MRWLSRLKIQIDNVEGERNTVRFFDIEWEELDRIIAIVVEAEWGSILCDDIPDPQCPICGGSKESGHGLVYETKRPCPYSDEWVKS